jgi:hypothetical protein
MNQLRSAEDIMYGKLWGPDCPPYEKSILQYAINGAKEYAQQFKEPQKDSGWISVKERLPESSDQKLLVFDGDAITFGRYIQGTEYGFIFKILGWGYTFNVTHWQPLPSTPKD